MATVNHKVYREETGKLRLWRFVRVAETGIEIILMVQDEKTTRNSLSPKYSAISRQKMGLSLKMPYR